MTMWGGMVLAGMVRLAAAAAPMYAGSESFRLAEDALLQLGGQPAVYLTAPDGQVEAIDAVTGNLRWRSGNTSFVLAARGDHVLALRSPGPASRGGSRPVLLDARTGRIRKDFRTNDGAVPGFPGYSINGSCLFSPFTLDGMDYLGWVVTWHPTPGGAYEGPDVLARPGSSGSRRGAVMVDWRNTRLDPAATALVDSVPVLFPPSGGVSATVTVDGLSAYADRIVEQGRVMRLVLRRWCGDERLSDLVLGDPPWNSCGASFTADGRHALAVWQVPDTRDPFRYHVRVFETASGRLIGEADPTSWPIGGGVIGNVLVTYFPWRVFAIDLTTGRERWSRPVKDLTYRGPYPPAAPPPERPELVPIR